MAFRNALWVPGFPEREDAVESGTLTTDDWFELRPVTATAEFIRIIANGQLWIDRSRGVPPRIGPPLNEGSSYLLIQNVDPVLEKPARFAMWVRRRYSSAPVAWSIRRWSR